VGEIIEEQGGFSISNLQVHDSMAGMNQTVINPKMIAYGLCATFGPIIRDHFGSSKDIMDEFIRTVEHHMNPPNFRDELLIILGFSLLWFLQIRIDSNSVLCINDAF
jgi:hypothetical protein